MGRYISTTGTSSAVLVEKSTTYTAKVNERVLANTSGGAWTLTMPANASLLVNDVVQVIDPTGNFNTNNFKGTVVVPTKFLTLLQNYLLV